MTETFRALAPAKVNLWLHIAAPDATGYHPLRSLVAFADAGDEVTFTPASTTGFTLSIDGPFSQGLSNRPDNLILKAATVFAAECPSVMGGHFGLTKNLPVASGLGGGSSDAGAALRLLRQVFAPDMKDAELEALAASLGADGAMCLWVKACIAEGYGEKLISVGLPAMPAVLINPGIECSTSAVYRAYDETPAQLSLGQDQDIPADAISLMQIIAANRNDLEGPAIALKPEIGVVLDTLNTQPEAMLARMSGSGATCFALCKSFDEAKVLGDRLKNLLPESWVLACHLS